jgi:required for meiotic nuclear division protein 1
VFPSGTVVAWSLPADVVEKLATVTLLPAAEGPAVADKEVEDLGFQVDPAADKTLVQNDGVVVLGTRLGDPRDLTLNKIAISSGLARSTKMAMLESEMEAYLESTRHIPDQLARGANLSRRLIWQKTGEVLALRSQLNHYNELTDALPDMLWDGEARLETYYTQIGRALNMGYRIEALNSKLTYAREVVQAAQEVITIMERETSERHGTRLEWIIIILIAIEVCFELYWVFIEDHGARTLEEVQRIRALVEETKSQAEKPGGKEA